MAHSKEPEAAYLCKVCGWSGIANGRQRCLACNRRRTKLWAAANPDKVRARARAYSRRFFYGRREDFNAKRRKYRKPETNKKNRLIRQRWLEEGDVTSEQMRAIYAASSGKCHYCGAAVRARFTRTDPRGFDHVIPKCAGGRHTAANIVVSCRFCNSRKAIHEKLQS